MKTIFYIKGMAAGEGLTVVFDSLTLTKTVQSFSLNRSYTYTSGGFLTAIDNLKRAVKYYGRDYGFYYLLPSKMFEQNPPHLDNY